MRLSLAVIFVLCSVPCLSGMPVPPAAPSHLEYKSGPTSVSIGLPVNDSATYWAFTDNSNNETGFIVERAVVGTDGTLGSFAAISVSPLAAHDGSDGKDYVTFTDSTVTGQKTYFYRVAATNGDGTSAFCKTKMIVTGAPATPFAPSGLTVTAPNFNITKLVFVDESWNELDFRIERCAGASCSDFAEVGSLAANRTIYWDQTTVASTSYTYRIRARKRDPGADPTDVSESPTPYSTYVYSSYSSSVSVTTPADSANTEVAWITSVSGVNSYVADQAKIGMKFRTPKDRVIEITAFGRFKVAGNTQAHDSCIQEWTNVGTGTDLRCVSWSAGETVAATDDVFAYKAPATKISLKPDTLYNAYTTETVGGDRALSYGTNSVSGYSPDSGSTIDMVYVFSGNWRESTIGPNAPTGVNFKYDLAPRVVASNPPTNFRASMVAPDRVQLSWTNNSTDQTQVQVERSAAGCGSFSNINNTAALADTYTNTGLSSSTAYCYRIRASDGTNNSAYATTVTVTTKAANNYLVDTDGSWSYVLSAAACGSLIELQAGSTHLVGTAEHFTLGGACTVGNGITLRSTGHASLPAGRVSPSYAPQMARIVGSNSNEVVLITGSYWTVTGIETDNDPITSVAFGVVQGGTNNILEKSYIHPFENHSTEYIRTGAVGLFPTGSDQIVRYNWIEGFTGNLPTGEPLATEAILATDITDLLVLDNHLNAGFVGYFGGGAGSTNYAANEATVVGGDATTSEFTLSTLGTGANALKIGDYVGVQQIPELSPGIGAECRIIAINTVTKRVTCDYPLLRDINEGTGTSSAPIEGNKVGWNGTAVRDVKFIHNDFVTDTEYQLWQWFWDCPCAGEASCDPDNAGNTCPSNGTKGYIEVKDGRGLKFYGNEFWGFDQGITFTSGNQNGLGPWQGIQDLDFRYNVFHVYSVFTVSVNREQFKRQQVESNWIIQNNLFFNEFRPRLAEAPGTPGTWNTGSMDSLDVYKTDYSHNTTIAETTAEYANQSEPSNFGGCTTCLIPLTNNIEGNPIPEARREWKGLSFSNNILWHFNGGMNCVGIDNPKCWQTSTQSKNLWVDTKAVGQAAMIAKYPSGSVLTPLPTNRAGLGLMSGTDKFIHGFALRADSAYKGDGDGGTDPGVSIPALLDALENVPSDYTPPSGEVTFPIGSNVLASITHSGTIGLTATATDNVDIASVEFVVNAESAGIDTSSPYSVSFNTASLTDGLHIVRVLITDTSGNLFTPPVITFNVGVQVGGGAAVITGKATSTGKVTVIKN